MEEVKKVSKTGRRKDLTSIIDKAILKDAIIKGEEVTPDEIMTKKERVLKNHIRNVYPIKEIYKGGVKYYYTKLNPTDAAHSGKISSTSIENIEAKIIAHYLDIELQSKTTVYDLFELALEDLTEETAKRHRQIWKKHFSSLSNKKIANLAEEDIRKCLSKMISDGIKAKAFNNATSTLNKLNDYCAYHHINALNIRRTIEEFRKYKLVGKKVFIKQFKRDTDLAFTEAEAILIIRYALTNPDPQNLAIATLLTTGLRAGELLALEPDDVRIDDSQLIVSKMENVKTREIINSCKDNSERIVFLNGDAKTVLKEVLRIREKECPDCPYLFYNVTSDDQKLHLRSIDNRLRKLQVDLGLAKNADIRSPHDCRRTYASILYQKQIDIKTIQRQLGHSNTAQTWDYIKDIVDVQTRANTLEKSCILQ